MTENNDKKPQALVIGLGNSGLKIINQLIACPEASWLQFLALDTDRKALDNCRAETKILAGADWAGGAGCGGDVTKGERTISLVRSQVKPYIESSSLLIVVGGLGGGTGTGGAPILARMAKKMKVPNVFIMTTPFAFEGHTAGKVADDGVKEMLSSIDALLCLPNDLLFSRLSSETPAKEAFEKADTEVARTILGISELLRCDNMITANFADLRTVLNNRRSTCGIGVGRADSDDGSQRCHIAMERMLESPLLGGLTQLKQAEVIFLTMIGGDDMTIGEIKKTLEAVERNINPKAKLIVGANTDSSYLGKVQITAVAIKVESTEREAPVANPGHFALRPEKRRRQRKTQDDTKQQAEQMELVFQNISRGFFTQSAPTDYRGDDLDIPTFQRRSITIDKGD